MPSVFDCPSEYSAPSLNSMGEAIVSSAAKIRVDNTCYDEGARVLKVRLELSRISTESDGLILHIVDPLTFFPGEIQCQICNSICPSLCPLDIDSKLR